MLLYHSIPGTVPNVMEITGDITLVFRYVACKKRKDGAPAVSKRERKKV